MGAQARGDGGHQRVLRSSADPDQDQRSGIRRTFRFFCRISGSAIKLPDGSEQTNVAASDRDMDRVFQAYPSLSYLRGDSDPSRHHPDPRASRREGLAIFNYPMSKEQWDTLQTAKVVVPVYAPEEPGNQHHSLTGQRRGFTSVRSCPSKTCSWKVELPPRKPHTWR